jgi:hypothetical protein
MKKQTPSKRHFASLTPSLRFLKRKTPVFTFKNKLEALEPKANRAKLNPNGAKQIEKLQKTNILKTSLRVIFNTANASLLY